MNNKEQLIEKLHKELDTLWLSRMPRPLDEKEQVIVREKIFNLWKEIDDYKNNITEQMNYDSRIKNLIDKYKQEALRQGHLASHGFPIPHYDFIKDLQSLID